MHCQVYSETHAKNCLTIALTERENSSAGDSKRKENGWGCMAERFTSNGEKVILTLAQSLFVQGVILLCP